MMPVTEGMHLGQIVGNVTHLLHLDEQWSTPGAPHATRRAVGKQMQTLLGGIGTEQQFLSNAANEIGNSNLVSRVRSAAVADNIRATVAAKFDHGGGALAVTQSHLQQIPTLIPADITAIQQQLDELAAGAATLPRHL